MRAREPTKCVRPRAAGILQSSLHTPCRPIGSFSCDELCPSQRASFTHPHCRPQWHTPQGGHVKCSKFQHGLISLFSATYTPHGVPTAKRGSFDVEKARFRALFTLWMLSGVSHRDDCEQREMIMDLSCNKRILSQFMIIIMHESLI